MPKASPISRTVGPVVRKRLDLEFDEVVDLALAFGQLTEVRHFPPLCTENLRGMVMYPAVRGETVLRRLVADLIGTP